MKHIQKINTNMVFKLALSLISVCLACIPVHGEDDPFSVDMTQFPYKTPEAAAFMHYGQENISEYTGNPNISIPLLTISDKDMSIPVSLSYKGDAIKVEEESSWVGLGWNLCIGGCINYVPAGSNDQTNPYNKNPFYKWEEIEEFCINQHPNIYSQYGTFKGVLTEKSIFDNEALKHNACEPDMYTVSVLGHHFSFFIHPASQAGNPQYVILGENDRNYHIEQFGINEWRIIDGLGNEYFFSAQEKSSSEHGTYTYTSAWYLTKVKTKKGADIRFHYSPHKILPLPSYNSYTSRVDQVLDANSRGVQMPEFISMMNKSVTEPVFDKTSTQQLLLDSITTSNWRLELVKSRRTDINGDAQKLNHIRLYSKTDNKVKKNINFIYDYFHGKENPGNEYLYSAYVKDRLKLCSISEGLDDDNLRLHSFSYDETVPLPWKRCKLEDLWGYYSLDGSLMSGMLTEIVYPTGGSTRYVYEPHTFNSDQFKDDKNLLFSSEKGDIVHGGGLRIKEISNCDADGSIQSRMVYTYEQSGKSYGKLLYPMNNITHQVYVPYKVVKNSQGYSLFYNVMSVETKSRNANLATGFSNLCLNGATVGYSTVDKKEYDSSGRLWRTVNSSYTNNIAYDHVNDTYELRSMECGKLKSQTVIDGSGHIMKKIENTYQNKAGDDCMVAVRYRERWVSFADHTYEIPLEPQCEAITYKYFNYWCPLSQTIVSSFGGNNSVASRNTTTYSLNSDKMVSKIVTTDNAGNSYTNDFTYDDYYKELLTRETLKYNVANIMLPAAKTVETEYGFKGLKYLPLKKTLSQAGNNRYAQITYKYDAYGNLEEEVKDSTEKVVYLYGYNHEYPVARIEGANYLDVEKWATPTLIKKISSDKGKSMESLLSTLRNCLSAYPVMITTYTYIPLVGISSVTDANGARTTFTYDADGKLLTVKDTAGNTVDKYYYHFSKE